MNNHDMLEFIEELERYIETLAAANDTYSGYDANDDYLTDY